MCARLDPVAGFSLEGQVAVVTGASSGLGRRFAEVLSAAGARVVLAARRVERIEDLAQRLPGAIAVACDVTVSADRERLLRASVDEFGKVDVLVNNAGTSVAGKALDESDETFARVIEVNLSAPFALCRDFGRLMADRGSGVVVNVVSILGVVGSGRIPQASYVASKGGLVNLTRELAAQWARHGVRVNALAPGWFPSEMTGDLFEEEKGRSYIERNTPMARAGREHELDGPLLLLCSDASSYMTGHTLIVDGGWTAI